MFLAFALLMVEFTSCSLQGEQVLVLYLGETRDIQCTAPDEDHLAINWIILPPESSEVLEIGDTYVLKDGIKGRNVTFTAATPQVNNTNLSCGIYDDLEPMNSYSSLKLIILIQGYLSAPDVTVIHHMENHSLLFSWSAPFSLNISDSEPDILYYVITIDSISITTMNTTDTHYLLQSVTCLFLEYHVGIAAVNVVGVGETYTSPPLTLEELSLTQTSVSFSKESLIIQIQVPTSCQREIHYTVELIPTFSNQSVAISNTTSMGETSLTLSSTDVQWNEFYVAIVRIMEGRSHLHHFNISTFDVQSVDITRVSDLEGFINITCHFAQGSLIKGCKIIISRTAGDKICEYIATREEGSSEALIQVILPAGHYRVEVYDDEDVAVKNAAYNTTLMFFKSSPMQNSAAEVECVVILDDGTPTVNSETMSNVIGIFTSLVAIVLFVACIAIFMVAALICYNTPNRTGMMKSSPPVIDLINTESSHDVHSLQRPHAVTQSPDYSTTPVSVDSLHAKQQMNGVPDSYESVQEDSVL